MIRNLHKMGALTQAWLTVLALSMLVCTPLRAGTFTFSLLPADGAVEGPPGSTVGWGYTLINQSATDWLVTIALNSNSFLDGSPRGLFDFPDLAPGAAVSIPFDEGAGTGLYQFTWDSSASLNFIILGRLR